MRESGRPRGTAAMKQASIPFMHDSFEFDTACSVNCFITGSTLHPPTVWFLEWNALTLNHFQSKWHSSKIFIMSEPQQCCPVLYAPQANDKPFMMTECVTAGGWQTSGSHDGNTFAPGWKMNQTKCTVDAHWMPVGQQWIWMMNVDMYVQEGTTTSAGEGKGLFYRQSGKQANLPDALCGAVTLCSPRLWALMTLSPWDLFYNLLHHACLSPWFPS